MTPIPEAPGSTVMGHFRVLGELGRGGMGIVHEAWDDKLHRRVALKVLPEDVARDASRRERFLREARAAAALSHPAIATVFQIEEWGGRLAIVMELAPGISLRRKLRHGPLPLREALRIATAIASALEAAHRAGIAHRDLKPENVMVAEPTVKLLDFGIAKALGAMELGDGSTHGLTDTGQVVGTAGYMAPEQATAGEVDGRADVFAFGVVVFEMVAGALPFDGPTPLARAIALSRDPPRDLAALAPDAPPELVALVERCLEKDPGARFADGGALAAALAEIRLDGAASPTGRATLPSSASPSTDPHAATEVAGASSGPVARLRPVGSAPVGAKDDVASQERPRSARWGLLVAVVAAAGVTVAGVLFWRAPAGGTGPGAATSPAGSAAIELGPAASAQVVESVSQVPAAEIAYRRGRQAMWDADMRGAGAAFDKAVDADPTCAPAHLRLAFLRQQTRPETAREHLAPARASRDRLSPRDQAMLEAIEAYVRDPPDLPEWEKRTLVALEKFPRDPELLVQLGIARQFLGKRPEAIEAYDTARTADPKLALASWLKAQVADISGRFDEARSGYDDCIAIAPFATACFWDRADLHSRFGRCAEAEGDYRKLTSLEADDARNYKRLASVLFGLGRPQDGIDGLLARRLSLIADEGERKRAELQDRIDLLAARGRFGEARDAVIAREKLVLARPDFGAKSADLGEQVQLARELAWLADEVGDRKKAGAIAMAVLRRKDATRRGSGSADASFHLMHWARREGLVSQEEFERARDALLADARKRQAREKPNVDWWFSTYAEPATNPLEARAAIEALSSFHDAPDPRAPGAGLAGRVYLLAGDVDRAIPLLRGALDSCLVLEDSTLVQKRKLLAEALEAKGDRGGACDAYAKVITTWGRATPRSVTADDAKARAKSLGCPPAR